MKIKEKGDMLEVTTEVYQAKNGGIFVNWGNTVIKLSKDDAEVIADSIPEIDREKYNEHYGSKKTINPDTCCIECKRYGTTPSNFPNYCGDTGCNCHKI